MAARALAAVMATTYGRRSDAAASSTLSAGVDKMFMEEMRQSVINHKPRKLPIPWEVSDVKMRDYEAELACQLVQPWAEGEVVVHNFSSRIDVFTTKLKGEALSIAPPGEVRTGGKGAEELLHLNGVVNPSAELVRIKWQMLRWAAIDQWMEHKLVEDPTKLTVLYSNGDTLFGGCTESALRYKYNQTISSSGGTQTVVAAGELSPFPWSLGWRYSQTPWASTRMATMVGNHGMTADWVSSFADCTNRSAGPCTTPPLYQYLNSGFLMGPLQDIAEILAEMRTYTGPENLWVNEFYLKHPGRITIDYTGDLVVSLHNMKANNLPVEVQASTDGTKALKNRASGDTVCFVHGNGNSFASLKDLAQRLAA